MSFNLYFASVEQSDWGVSKFLYNQYDDRKRIHVLRDELLKESNSVFLDCGAYPAFTRGVEIDIDDYIKFINDNHNLFTVIASLDVIPKNSQKCCIEYAAMKSWDNFIYMRDRVVCPEKIIPTFHQTEPFQYLQNILKFQDDFGMVDYFAIGALTGIKDYDSRVKFISECFTIISGFRPDIRVHAFGMTDLKILEQFPFYSADSTAYILSAGMGEIITKFGRVIVSNRCSMDLRSLNVLQKYVDSFGFNLSDLAKSREERIKFNIRFLQEWERNYVCRWEKSGRCKKLF